MKMMKLVYPMAVVLALTLATTGRRNHKPYGVTPIPNGQGGQVGEPGAGGTMGGNQPGGGQTASLAEFENMIEDRAALANYTIHFAFDSAAIRHSEDANLQAVASALNSDPSTKLLVEGNCDERGTEEYNRALGERRALALREALAKIGVDAARVRTISYGKDQPVDPGHNEAAWAKNRRGQFDWCTPKTPAP